MRKNPENKTRAEIDANFGYIRSTALEGSIIFVIPEKINTIPSRILTTLTLFTNSP